MSSTIHRELWRRLNSVLAAATAYQQDPANTSYRWFCPDTGICANLVWEGATPAPVAPEIAELRSLFSDLALGWSGHSGSKAFPIEGNAQGYFAARDGALWAGDAGDKRRSLARYVLGELGRMLDIPEGAPTCITVEPSEAAIDPGSKLGAAQNPASPSWLSPEIEDKWKCFGLEHYIVGVPNAQRVECFDRLAVRGLSEEYFAGLLDGYSATVWDGASHLSVEELIDEILNLARHAQNTANGT